MISYILATALFLGLTPAFDIPAGAAGTGAVTITKNPKNWRVVENLDYSTLFFTEKTAKLYKHSASETNCADLILGSTLIQTHGGEETNCSENDVYAQFTIDKSADIYIAARAERWGWENPMPLSDTYLPWLRTGTTASFGGYEQVMLDENTPAVIHLTTAMKYHLYKKRVEVPEGQNVTVSLGGAAKSSESMYAAFVQFDYIQPWPKSIGDHSGQYDKLKIRFRPVDNYTCEQNPPDFSWWKVENAASYDLIVCRDKELTDIVYEKKDITDCFYNFDEPFPPGIYYWSVRFHLPAPQYEGWPQVRGAWQPARRFLVEDDAFAFPVPDVTVSVNAFAEQAHPRFYAGMGSLAEFRQSVKDSGLYDRTVKELNAVMNDWRGQKPLDTTIIYDRDTGVNATNNLWGEMGFYGVPRLDNACFVYLINPDAVVSGKKVVEYAVKNLVDFVSFTLPDWNEDTDSNLSLYAMRISRWYDWMYDALTPEQRAKILSRIAEVYEKGNKLFEKNTFYDDPSGSHEWNCGRYMMAAALLTAGEIEETQTRKSSIEIAQSMIKYYINQTSPFQIEDGTYYAGLGYFKYINVELEHLLKSSGLISLWDKAYYRNMVYFPMYMYPVGSASAFGDGAYRRIVEDDGAYIANTYYRLAGILKNPFAKFELDEIAKLSRNNKPTETNWMSAYFDLSGVEAESPAVLPKAKYFKDSGYAGMHSDLTDKDRVSLFFRSSYYGTRGHSHADNNAFVIEAFGEKLAIDSGYYPYYQSPHHKNYTTQTYAHNAITYNGGKGQSYGDIEAEGRITGFLTHSDFDYVGSDATKAYREKIGNSADTLGKVKRHILYIRPDVFVVIDDLAALPNEEVSFEYWLQSEKEIPEYTDSTAKIVNNGASLDAEVQYPAQTTARYLEGFTDLDGNEWPKEKDNEVTGTVMDPDAQVHNRIVFQTPRVNQTKMVTTLAVHRTGEAARQLTKTEYETYLRLDFADGTKVYVNKGDSGSAVTAENGTISFTGAALAVKGDSVLLAEGTNVTIDGVQRIAADEPVSAVSGNGELSVSNLEKDAEVSVYYPNVTGLTSIRDAKQRELSDRVTRNGITWTKDPEYVDLKLYNGQYLMKVTAQQPVRAEVKEYSVPFLPDEDSSVTFGTLIASGNIQIEEYGMLCHTTNPLPEYQSQGVWILEGKSLNAKGQFGIELLGTTNLSNDTYYMRPYMIYRKDGELHAPVYAEQSIYVHNP